MARPTRLQLAGRTPIGLHPKPTEYFNPSGAPFPSEGERDDNRRDVPWRQPLFNAAGGLPQLEDGYESHSILITRQAFTIPSSATAFAVDGSDADDNGNKGNILLADIVPFGRALLIPRSWVLAISTSENSQANINLTFQSLTAIMRRISNGDIIWAWSSDAPPIAQFYVGMDVPLPQFKSDFYVPIDPETYAFQDIELSYSAVFKNSAANHAASIYGTFQYDVVVIEK